MASIGAAAGDTGRWNGFGGSPDEDGGLDLEVEDCADGSADAGGGGTGCV